MNQKVLNPILEQHARVIERFFELFPRLADEQNQEWYEILKRTQTYHYPANTMLATAGTTCSSFMLLLEGSVRVFQHAEDGREVTLYQIGRAHV